MPTKVVRFARVKTANEHYAGHYELPSIAPSDVVQLMTLTLDITLTLRPELRDKLVDGPAEIRITPGEPQTITAVTEIILLQEIKKSNVTVRVLDWDDKNEINYLAQTIGPCT